MFDVIYFVSNVGAKYSYYCRWKNVNFCCVCGDDKSSSRYTKIFSTVGKEKKLSEQIHSLTNFKLQESDTNAHSLTNFKLQESDTNAQSLKICRSCEGKLMELNDFKSCAVATLESIQEQATPKRCLTFSPSKSGSQMEKRTNVEDQSAINEESRLDFEVKER